VNGPVARLIAAFLVAVTATGFAVGGLLLVALAVGQVPFLGSTRGAP
jgi:hypothetical protein